MLRNGAARTKQNLSTAHEFVVSNAVSNVLVLAFRVELNNIDYILSRAMFVISYIDVALHISSLTSNQ